MHCPYCRHTDTKVLDSRVSDDGTAIRRRRRCEGCDKRFTTVELMQLTVLKRSGATEPFNREKAVAGVRKACKGRPVSEDDLACLGQTVEDVLRNEGAAELPAHEVGLAILGPLRALDPVAYLRFASVYKAFSSADDFEDEIALLRMEQAAESSVEEVAKQPSRDQGPKVSAAGTPPVEEGAAPRTPPVEEGALRPSRDQGEMSAAGATLVDQGAEPHAVPTG
jgi:transcriptional repressor NrdR